ncbi:hypothetical protein GLOIN_2v327476 [Rhizophagus irregularis DAOM 181602=DAOM 197198]|uniref:3CxxC-type domain-containing protein n=1 Tax=Rhizophagus irregularis (strain DAOM 181602 / DAOM 197198 / MUCL 43194) TaxID=747089 RepID=A0A2P4PNJ4_RHIID|nr:hypothetical protein GLOIN_2v327476 [Rhizophagus irregularis DAOM 181602=DAOM 197198]POG66966.1 hypothetical protein GLOIN_2v327476 [Rhizophagus irregularis DAOM 181602=DAOM 197198]|eukprot:XP_025173832.1 hypothetical protein GLOIN_2v327476 [Rhizophagus irregularis DAOM 181602=DAOM 197198]
MVVLTLELINYPKILTDTIMSKEVNSSNDQDTAENEIVSKLEVSNLEESNTTLTSSSWDDGNTTVRKLEESNTKVIISGRITSIINWEESDITGLERCNINKLIDAFLGYRWESEKRHKWEKYELEKRQIIEIIRHLAYNNSYRVHGYWICHQWQCGHRPQQCLSVRQCENKHKYVYYWNECNHNQKCPNRTECRKKYNLRQWQRENFCQREWQKQDDGGNLISSFLLYNSENSNENPDMEIIRHLVWNDKYRVFGNWGCSSCRKRWRSAYTWISLQKYIEKTPGKRLNRFNDDYIIQKCKKEECGDDGIILGYEHLVLSEDGVEHKRHLCAKCLNNETCLESGTYYGKQK